MIPIFPRTVFRPPLSDVEISVGGHSFGISDIGTIRLTRATDGIPVSGICTAELYLKIHTDEPFTVGSELTVSIGGLQALPKFTVSKPGYGNGITEITAYDTCRALDRYFDTSGYFSEEKDYEVFLIVDAIASQCGFNGADNAVPNISVLPYSAIRGKTCRQILKELSACGCGVWYCSNSQSLRFKPFGEEISSIELPDDSCSGFRRGSVKGPITSLIAENPTLKEPFILGTQTGFLNAVKTKGKYIDEAVALNIFNSVNGKTYRAFYCDSAMTDVFPEAFSTFSYGGNTYSAVSTVSYLTPYGIRNRITAPNISEDATDYIGAVEYEMRDRLVHERTYVNMFISENSGLTLTYLEDDPETEEE